MKKINLLAMAVFAFHVMFICNVVFAQEPGKKVPKGDNEETLFNTLNDTLEENRKVRIAMKELQLAL